MNEQPTAAITSSDTTKQLASTSAPAVSRSEKQHIKCVVWDLDNTLWDGVLLEDREVSLREQAFEIVKALDERGILQSVASKNDYDCAIEKLQQLGVRDYFLYPQINWNSKVSSIEQIVSALNISVDVVAFIDDQPFEREEVKFSLPAVLCLDADFDGLLDRPELNPRFITSDSRMRRLLYLRDIERNRVEEEFVGPRDEFLAGLQMVMTIAPAGEDDLRRAEELTVRTNQLNTTGYTYSYDELNHFRKSSQHKLLIADLSDKFGSYGKIGLALVERQDTVWTIKLMLMSCRVMSRGVGTILLSHIMQEAKKAGATLRADFVSNDRNRMMYVTYKLAGFREIDHGQSASLLVNDLSRIQPFPDYVTVKIIA